MKNIPLRTVCRIDYRNMGGHHYPMLIDTTDETILFIGLTERTLTEIYANFKYAICHNIGISSFLPTGYNMQFKKLDGVLYKDF